MKQSKKGGAPNNTPNNETPKVNLKAFKVVEQYLNLKQVQETGERKVQLTFNGFYLPVLDAKYMLKFIRNAIDADAIIQEDDQMATQDNIQAIGSILNIAIQLMPLNEVEFLDKLFLENDFLKPNFVPVNKLTKKE